MMRTTAFGLAFLGLLTWTVTTSAEENSQPQEQHLLAAKHTVIRQAQRGNSFYLSDIVRSFTRVYFNLPEAVARGSRPEMPIAAGCKTPEDSSIGILGKSIHGNADHAHQITSAAGGQ